MKFTTKSAAVALIASAGLAVGCDNSSEPVVTPPAPAVDVKTTADSAADAAAKVKSDATAAASDASSAVATQAQKLYDDAMTAIKNTKWEDAQKYVDQLMALKDKLPAEWQTKVNDLSKMLADAKAKLGALPTGGVPSVPAVPGAPK